MYGLRNNGARKRSVEACGAEVSGAEVRRGRNGPTTVSLTIDTAGIGAENTMFCAR